MTPLTANFAIVDPSQLGSKSTRLDANLLSRVSRVILGTDAPAGSGVQPLGILRMVSLLSSLGKLPAEIVFCFGTGNTARMRALDCGMIELGRSADFVIMDRAQHSPGKTILDSVQLGDLPGIGMTIIDGIVLGAHRHVSNLHNGSRHSIRLGRRRAAGTIRELSEQGLLRL